MEYALVQICFVCHVADMATSYFNFGRMFSPGESLSIDGGTTIGRSYSVCSNARKPVSCARVEIGKQLVVSGAELEWYASISLASLRDVCSAGTVLVLQPGMMKHLSIRQTAVKAGFRHQT